MFLDDFFFFLVIFTVSIVHHLKTIDVAVTSCQVGSQKYEIWRKRKTLSSARQENVASLNQRWRDLWGGKLSKAI